MKTLKLMSAASLCLAAATVMAQEPVWNASAIKDCDRACLVGVLDGTRRGAPPDAPPGMLQNLVTMETFSVRGGLIHHVEAAPFVTLPYGLGNGWTPGSGR